MASEADAHLRKKTVATFRIDTIPSKMCEAPRWPHEADSFQKVGQNFGPLHRLVRTVAFTWRPLKLTNFRLW